MILTNCNCGEKVECGCGTLSFDTYNASATSVLEVGNLVADGEGCTLDEYVIDWYRDGEHALVTGKGLDPDIQAFHPMTGSAAVPVIGGTWVPVVRYVVVDGVQLFLEPKPCRNWCDIITDLPTITIARLDCATSNTTGQYQFILNYSSTDPSSLPSRLLAWDLPDPDGVDGRLKHFALRFTAYNVVDEIEVLFNGVTSLAKWQIGSNSTGGFSTRLLTEPYRYAFSGGFKFVVTIPDDYVLGDYLLIKITPSVIQTTVTQTDWRVELKCIPNTVDFDCSLWDDIDLIREVDISDWSFTWEPSLCGRLLQVKMKNPTAWPIPSHFTNTNHVFAYWCQLGGFNNFITQDFYTSGYFKCLLPQQKPQRSESYYGTNWNIRTEAAGLITLNKTGYVYTFTFDSVNDYNTVYNSHQAAIASTWWTNRELTDDTKVEYYRFWYLRWKSRPINCGDNALSIDRILIFHHTASVVFDDTGGVYTCSITTGLISTPNNWNNESCSSNVTSINSYLNQVNATANLSFSDETSYCFEYVPFRLGYGFLEPTVTVSRDVTSGYTGNIIGYTHECLPFPETVQSESIWNFYIVQLRVTIDITVDEYGNWQDGRDPLENFTLYDRVNSDGTLHATGTKLLQIEDGVQIYPTP